MYTNKFTSELFYYREKKMWEHDLVLNFSANTKHMLNKNLKIETI